MPKLVGIMLQNKKEIESLLKDFQVDSTDLGKIKTELIKTQGIEFIEKYDILLDEIIHEKLYKNKLRRK